MYSKLPKHIRFILSLFVFEMIVFTLFRVAFFFAFAKYADSYTSSEILFSFWLGFRFDTQLFAIAFLPLLLFGGWKHIGVFSSNFGKYFWISYVLLANLLFTVIYIINFPYYDFFKKMVDSSIIRYFYDIGEAMTMVVEGYPLISTSIATLIAMTVLYIIIKNMHDRVSGIENNQYSLKQKTLIYAIFSLIYIFSCYGKFELYPWRWSEAFYSPNNFLSYLASNPVTYFENTLKNKEVKYDIKEVKKHYDRIAEFLEVEPKDVNKLSIIRKVTPNHEQAYTFNKPNIVFILGESSSYARSSISGNPLDPTPFIKYMSDHGLTYSRYYTPHSGTARSVWTSTTGLTDVERMKTSSRNPMTVSQHMIINADKDYEKFYFIGGSLSWGNIRGVVSNINGIHKHEEQDYPDSPRNDVWGISDADLVGEVNDVLKSQKKPFIAYVQLSGNHSPNTIPENNYGFEFSKGISKEKLLDYSFDGHIDELNGQRFLDHSVKRLVTLAKNETYFDNTIFIFVGDHGLPKKAIHMPQAEQVFLTHTIHTPLVFYAPKLFGHKKIDYPVSEVDIMATIAGLIGEPYVNSTMGRDILEKDFQTKEHYAFYMTHETNPKINLIAQEYILRMRADGSDAKLYEYYFKDKPVDRSLEKPELFAKLRDTCRGIYEQTRYIRYFNSQVDVDKYLSTMKPD